MKEKPSVYGSLQNTIPDQKEKNVYVNIINRILKYIQEEEFTALKELHKKLPRMHAYTQTGSKCNSDNICIFMKIVAQLDSYVEQLNLYENSLVINGRKRVLLNTETDYIEFLKQKQVDRILQVLGEQQITSMSIATALKITSKFTELQSYYMHVQSFNGDIAKGDIGYILGRLDTFKKRITSVVGTFKSKISTLLIQMMIGAGLEEVHSAISLALVVADFCNPMGFIFGGAYPKDLMDAIADVANAAAQLAKGTAVTVAWNRVKQQSIEINNKFKKNREFLEKVKELVYEESQSRADFEYAKNTFLEQYNNYDPQVLPDICSPLSNVRLETLKEQSKSLEEPLKKLQDEVVMLETKYINKRAKFLDDAERFRRELRKVLSL